MVTVPSTFTLVYIGSSIEFQPVHHLFYEFIAASSIPATSTVYMSTVIMLNSLTACHRVTQSYTHKHPKGLETSVLWGCFMMDLGKSCCLFSLVKCEFTLEIANKQKIKTCFLGNGTACATLCGASLPYVNVIRPWESICPELWRRTVGDGQKTAALNTKDIQRWWKKYQEKGQVDDKDILICFHCFWVGFDSLAEKRCDTTLVRLVIDHENDREIWLLNYHFVCLQKSNLQCTSRIVDLFTCN